MVSPSMMRWTWKVISGVSGDPVFGVALVDVQEACDGVFGVVAQFLGHVLLHLRVCGGGLTRVEGVVGVVDAGGHGEIEDADGYGDYACGFGEHEKHGCSSVRRIGGMEKTR